MSANAEKILQEVLNLPPQDRAEMLERLLATFQEPPDAELDKLWAQEAEDRLDAYDRGELGGGALFREAVRSVAADDSHRDAFSYAALYRCPIIAAVEVDPDLFRLGKVEPAREILIAFFGREPDIHDSISGTNDGCLIVGIAAVDVSNPP